MLVNRKQVIVEDSFHEVWNSQIGKSDLGLIEKRMGKRNLRTLYILPAVHMRKKPGGSSPARARYQAAGAYAASNPEGALM